MLLRNCYFSINGYRLGETSKRQALNDMGSVVLEKRKITFKDIDAIRQLHLFSDTTSKYQEERAEIVYFLKISTSLLWARKIKFYIKDLLTNQVMTVDNDVFFTFVNNLSSRIEFKIIEDESLTPERLEHFGGVKVELIFLKKIYPSFDNAPLKIHSNTSSNRLSNVQRISPSF